MDKRKGKNRAESRPTNHPIVGLRAFSIFSSPPPSPPVPFCVYKIHKKDDSRVFLTLRRSRFVALETRNSIKLFLIQQDPI